MRKCLAYICLTAGSACIGVGGTLLVATMLPLEGLLCIILGVAWLYLSEILLNPTRGAETQALFHDILALLSQPMSHYRGGRNL